MMEMRQDRIAFDRASVRTFDETSGHLHVKEANLSRAAINEYAGSEIPGGEKLGLDPNRLYRLLRDPKELEKATPSIDGKPLLYLHKEVNAKNHDHAIVVGAISEPRYVHPHLVGKLAVWTQEAIDAIRSGAQRELSCGYHYQYDPTPGSYEGQPYDGVMRNLAFNHCALVAEGRAGPTCYVGDELNDTVRNLQSMTKTVLSRKAVAAQGALVAYLAPKMAQDKKIDWTPTFKDVTAGNFKDKKAAIAADVMKQINGKLAKDENVDLEKVAEILEAVASVDPGEPEVVNPAMPDKGMIEDDDDEDLCKKLMAKGYSEEEAKKIAARTPAPAAADGDDDEEEKKKAAMDAMRNQLNGMVSKQAMDAAVIAAERRTEDRVMKRLTAIQEAKDFCETKIGKFGAGMSFDSAEGVYIAALASKGVSDVEDLPAKALHRILAAYEAPGETAARTAAQTARMAHDEAAKNLGELFGTSRIGHA